MGPMEAGQICAGGEAGKDSCQVTGGHAQYLMMRHDIRETVEVLCPMRAMVSTSSSVMSATVTAALR